MDAFAASWDVGARCRRLSWLLRASVVEAKHAELVHVLKAGFNPNQPRVPVGNPDGGHWTGDGGSGGGEARPTQNPSSDHLTNIPKERPESARVRHMLIRQVAKHVARLALEHMRFRQGTRIFQILAVIDVEERRRWLKCWCEEREL